MEIRLQIPDNKASVVLEALKVSNPGLVQKFANTPVPINKQLEIAIRSVVREAYFHSETLRLNINIRKPENDPLPEPVEDATPVFEQ